MAIGESTRFIFIDDNCLSFDPNIYEPKIITDEHGNKLKLIELRADDIFLIAGFYTEQKNLKAILDAVNSVKEKYDIPPWLPVKWNMKDTQLAGFYRDHDKLDTLKKLLGKSMEIRCELLDVLGDMNCKVICSGVGRISHSVKPVNFYQMALTNLLQRLGKDCQMSPQIDFPRLVVVSDWPSSDLQRSLFDTYSHGYHFGRDQEGQRYHCGPLSGLNTYPDLYCGVTLYSPFLQLADILVGALHSMFRWCFKNTGLQIVQQTFPKVRHLFRKDASGRFLRRGLVVAPKHVESKLVQRLAVLERHLV